MVILDARKKNAFHSLRDRTLEPITDLIESVN